MTRRRCVRYDLTRSQNKTLVSSCRSRSDHRPRERRARHVLGAQQQAAKSATRPPIPAGPSPAPSHDKGSNPPNFSGSPEKRRQQDAQRPVDHSPATPTPAPRPRPRRGPDVPQRDARVGREEREAPRRTRRRATRRRRRRRREASAARNPPQLSFVGNRGSDASRRQRRGRRHRDASPPARDYVIVAPLAYVLDTNRRRSRPERRDAARPATKPGASRRRRPSNPNPSTRPSSPPRRLPSASSRHAPRAGPWARCTRRRRRWCASRRAGPRRSSQSREPRTTPARTPAGRDTWRSTSPPRTWSRARRGATRRPFPRPSPPRSPVANNGRVCRLNRS